MKYIMKSLMALFIALSSSFIVYSMNPTVADAIICPPGQSVPYDTGTKSFDKCGAGTQATEKNSPQMSNIKKANGYFKDLAIAIAGFSAAVTVLMIVYAAYLYTVSEGEAEKIKKAKHHLITAGFGFTIASLSVVIYGIVEAVIK